MKEISEVKEISGVEVQPGVEWSSGMAVVELPSPAADVLPLLHLNNRNGHRDGANRV